MTIAVLGSVGLQAYGQDANGERSSSVLEEIVVTGTFIRGAEVTAPLTTVTRAEIEAAGYSTLHEALQALPQNFGGGPNEDTTLVPGADAEAGNNISFGSSINLRGLGADSTLVLLNGRRMAPAGYGNFVDVSMIPASAIERMEVLADGASALYGADAVGGVVNIILRSGYDGSETRLRAGSVTSGNSAELSFGQVLGKDWGSGNALFAYSYRERDALRSADRDYAADSDLTALGGSDRGSTYSNPGNITNFVNTWAIPAGQDGTALQAADLLAGQPNMQNIRENTDILPEQKQHGFLLTARQRIGKSIDLYFDALYSTRDTTYAPGGSLTTLVVPPSNPFYVNPSGTGPVYVTYWMGDDFGRTLRDVDVEQQTWSLGAARDFGETWRASATASMSTHESEHLSRDVIHAVNLAAALADPDPATAFNPFGDGTNTPAATVDSFRGFTRNTLDARVSSVDIRADGTLFSAWAGDVKLATGVNVRREQLERSTYSWRTTPEPVAAADPDLRRDIAAAYAELYVPLIGASSDRQDDPLVLSLAGRYEDYDDFGSAIAPKAALAWRPVEALTLRASWGESFRAPLLTELDDSQAAAIAASLTDPAAATGRSLALVLGGNNSELQEERATTWSAGFDLHPDQWPAFTFTAGYFSIDYEDRIASPDELLSILQRADQYASIITRNPDDAVVQGYMDGPGYVGAPIDASLIDVIVDARLRNIARLEMRGFDVGASYTLQLRDSRLTATLNGTLVSKLARAFSETSPLLGVDDTVGQPPDSRWRAGFDWRRGALSAALYLNWQGAYRDVLENRRVDDLTTVDLRVAWQTGDGAELWSGLEVGLSAINVFDEDPPFVDHVRGVGFDPQNADPRGRFVSLDMVKRW